MNGGHCRSPLKPGRPERDRPAIYISGCKERTAQVRATRRKRNGIRSQLSKRLKDGLSISMFEGVEQGEFVDSLQKIIQHKVSCTGKSPAPV